MMESESDVGRRAESGEGLLGQIEEVIHRAQTSASDHRYHEAITLYTSLLESLPTSDESGRRTDVLCRLGELYVDVGDRRRALDYYFRALEGAEEQGDFETAAVVLQAVGVIFGESGDYERACEHLERSLTMFHDVGNLLMELKVIRNLGAVWLSRGDPETALEFELRALAVYDALGDRENAAAAMITVGRIYEKRNDPHQALPYYLRAAESLDQEGYDRLFTAALLGAGRTSFRTGDLESARTYLEQGLAISRESEDLRIQGEYHSALADLLERLEDRTGALEHLRHYIAIREASLDQENRQALAELGMRFDLEREMKEEELRRQHDVTRTMVQTQEAERTRVAGDLHDGVGQLLAAIRVHLLRLDGTFGETDQESQRAWERSLELTEQASRDVRTISHTLSSSTLRELGILPAFREMIADMNRSDAIDLRFSSSGIDDGLPEEISLSLFRIAQELLLNMLRHSEASEGSIELVRYDDVVILMVEDDGVGFDPQDKREGMGTRNIEARVKGLDGTVRFDSHPGRGTTVTVEVPLP